MAYALNPQAHTHTHDVEQPDLFARLRQSFADYREYLATYKELNALSDRHLADFGVSRLNVREIARAAVYGDLSANVYVAHVAASARPSGRSIEDAPLALKLNIIISSTRPGRIGPFIAEWLKGAAVAHGKFAVELVDLADFHLPLLDEAAHPATRQYASATTKRRSASVASAEPSSS